MFPSSNFIFLTDGLRVGRPGEMLLGTQTTGKKQVPKANMLSSEQNKMRHFYSSVLLL